MTAKEQIIALNKIGCGDAVREIGRNNNNPLSSDRLNHHIEIAIDNGLVARVEGLIVIGGAPLTALQVERLTRRCLKLEWVVDALSASKMGSISRRTRRELINALVLRKMADNQKEAAQLLENSE